MPRFQAVRMATAAMLMIAAAAMAAANGQQTAGERIDDSIIMTKIKATLVGDPEVKAREIHVVVHDGRVQLNGFVATAGERSYAADLTAAVDGVTAVNNNLEVQKSIRTAKAAIDDAGTTTKVKAALIADERTKARDISVVTRQGVVLLGGFVSTDAERSAAGEVAAAVSGVTRVDNQLALK